MNQECTKCQAVNPAIARFCRNCGNTLSAIPQDGKTLISVPVPSLPLQLSEDETKTIVQRAHKSFGDAPVAAMPHQGERADQREQTAFVVDRSSSMDGRFNREETKQEAACRANINMVLNKERIDPLDEIALVAFRSRAEVVLGLSQIKTCKRQIIEAIQSLTPDNGTDIDTGLKATRDVFDWSQQNVVRRIVLLTDGQGGDPLETADDLKARGVVIDVIGVGENPSGVDEKLLRKVASVVEGEVRYRFIKDQQTLVAHYTQLANKTATSA